MIYCSACGTQNSPSSSFCANCGASMAKQQEKPAKSMGAESRVEQPPTYQQPPAYQQQPRNYQQQQPAYRQHPSSMGRIVARKDPTLAAVISLFLPGLGYAYFGQVGKGIGMFVLIIVTYFLFIGFIIHIYSIFNSYSECKKYNYAMGYDY
jgi:TM2 domain-containing membrane protein YozV